MSEAQQVITAPELRSGVLSAKIRLDGVLDEPAWTTAPSIESLTMSEPTAGGTPAGRTRVKVLAGDGGLFVGIICDDPDPAGIVSFTKQRDGALASEDHVSVVIDTFLDGRSGYLFEVNPSGARYDALINPGSADANSDWDGIWDAATHRDDHGWSVEIWIPIQTLAFKHGLTRWHFNVERRIQRLQETDRWAAARPDWALTQMSRAGLLTDLPEFGVGLGLTIRPSVTAGGGIPAPLAPFDPQADASLDVMKRLGGDLLGFVSVNTDFAETQVDTRQTNLTRFPLFFPEKRSFFLEGSDVFQFGLGLGESLIPFFSRRVGLVAGQEVPILIAGKTNGRVGGTSVAALVAQMRSVDGVAPTATLGAVRIRQDVLAESSAGVVATVGDPTGLQGSWLLGSDFTYRTSHFHGDKNFRLGVSGQVMNREGATGDRTAASVRVEYPNDLWNLWLGGIRIGDGFSPSLGFVPRPGVYRYDGGIDYSPRFHNGWLRQWFAQVEPVMVTDLHGHWGSYELFTAPINWRFESGDRLEFNIVPEGEQLDAAFPLHDVVIPPGNYHWLRYRLEAGSAAKRPLSAQGTWRFGGFYSGTLNQVLLVGTWHPTALVGVDFSGEHDQAELQEGRFTSTLAGVTVNLYLSPNLNVSSFVQYDTDSRSLGTNTRLRWTFTPVGELFVIYNHNVENLADRWQLESNQLLIKFQYAFRY
jgi:hypothetical protein